MVWAQYMLGCGLGIDDPLLAGVAGVQQLGSPIRLPSGVLKIGLSILSGAPE